MWAFLFLLFLPVAAPAVCTVPDEVYDVAINQGDYATAFNQVAQDLHLSPQEKSQFHIVSGFSHSHDDRNGQSDPDTMETTLDPGLFIEGKEGACQGIAHELTHLHQFKRDQHELVEYYGTHPVSASGWDGCHRETLAHLTPDQAIDQAYTCVQDNDLATHAAAMDIEAVLAQIPYAPQKQLRDEDLGYLVVNITTWADHQTMITDRSNESYYVPDIKRKDVHTFCKGVVEARKRFANTNQAMYAWQYFCSNVPSD